MSPAPEVADVLKVDVSRGERVLVVSDLHLRPAQNDASRWAVPEIVSVLKSWEGPGVLLMAGDILEMWFVQPPDAVGSVSAHAALAEEVRRFGAQPGRRVIYLVGNHDARIGWDGNDAEIVSSRFGAELAFAAEVTIDGSKKVRVEHGHAFDPANAFKDPRDPGETPLGQHIVQEILPSMSFTESGFLDGMESLSDPRTFPAFLTSRLFYRRVLKDAKWLLIPFLLFMLVRIPITYLFFAGKGHNLLPRLTKRLAFVDVLFLVIMALFALILLYGAHRAWKAANAVVAEKRGRSQNDNSRAAAVKMVNDGYAGVVVGHTHHPELSDLGAGFYANTGSCTKVVDRVDARMELPHVFVPRVQLSYVDMQAGDGWTVRLIEGRRDLRGSTLAERRVEKKKRANRARPLGVAGVYPGGPFTT